jgi:long-chain acyl-CoA synthetase
LHVILKFAASQFPDRTATYFGGAELTFREIKRRADRLSAALAALGVGQGDRVGIMLPNCPQYPISFFALMRLGAVAVNVNPAYTAAEVSRTTRDAELSGMIVLDALAPVVQQAGGIPWLITTSVAEYSSGSVEANVSGTLSFSRLIENADPREIPPVTIEPDDVAVLQYTGGTTGVPKGAMLTHGSCFANVVQSALWNSYFTRRGEEKILLVLPYFHVYGMVVGMLLGFWNGTTQILLPKYNVDLMLDHIERLRPTMLPGVPTLFTAILNHPRAKTCGLEYVRGFNSGAAPLPLEVIRQFERLSGGTLREGYGLTEVSCTASSTPLLARRKPGSVGLPVVGTDMRIVHVDGSAREVIPGEEGELCIRGPQLMKGYWRNPAETAAALPDGWLRTGDIARMDEDGYFYIVQRKKDMINVAGFKVFPTEVDDVLYMHPAVMEAAVIGVPDAYRGEVVKAFVVRKPDTLVSADELIEHCRKGLAKFKVPVAVEFVESLPKSAVGKILRRALREREEQHRNA